MTLKGAVVAIVFVLTVAIFIAAVVLGTGSVLQGWR